MVACDKKEQAMSEKNRKSFSSQHKAKVALEAIRGTKTLNEIAQEFAVHPTQVGEWKKLLLAQVPTIFGTKRGPKSDDPSINPERLYSEIGRLKMELDWLKKKSGISQ
jgi:transposase-like protein